MPTGREYRFEERTGSWLGTRVCVFDQAENPNEPIFAAYSHNPEDARRAARQFTVHDDQRKCEAEQAARNARLLAQHDRNAEATFYRPPRGLLDPKHNRLSSGC